MNGYHDEPREDIRAVLDPRGRRVLDVGCGSGILGRALRQSGAVEVVGVELDADAAGTARHRLDRVLCGDLMDLGLPEGLFDIVIFADVLEHLADPDAALARWLKAAAPGATIVVSVPNFRFWSVLLGFAVDRWEYADAGILDRTHLRIFTRRALLQLLDAHGLELVSLSRTTRLFADQSKITRAGVVMTRLARATVARLAKDLFTYQYVAVCRTNP